MSTVTTSITHWEWYDSDSSSQLFESSSSECSAEPSSRLEAVLFDYKKFLAARIIQCHVRGWLYRVNSRRQNAAATTIAAWWRGYWVRSNRFAMIEAQLQQRLINYYHHKANQVQSLFRGWQTRMKFQDFEGMQQLRMQYAEDVLSTLAKVLHKMRKDHLLPGIYGLRGSHLLKKIEGLTQTFGYRFHNGRMRASIAQKRAQFAQRRRDFQKARFYTSAPFPGPNAPIDQITDLCMAKRIGTQQQRVFLLYDKCSRDSHVKNILLKISARLRHTMAMNRQQLRSHFCKDLIKRTIQTALNLPLNSRQTEMVQQFINDLMAKVEEYSCHCEPKVLREWCN